MADAQVEQLGTELASSPEADAQVEQLGAELASLPNAGGQVEQLGAELASLPNAGVQLEQFGVELVTDVTVPALVEQLGLELVSENDPEVAFVNDRLPGITHIEITLSDDTVEPWAVIPMDDPLGYDHGRKPSRVLTWGDIRRSTSDFYGQPVAADFRFTVRDKDLHVLDYLGDPANVFTNRYTVTKSIRDVDRRLGFTRRTIFRGPIRSVQPRAGATHEFTVKDYLQERFGPNSDLRTIPRRKVLLDDFPGCAATLVNSSAEQYTVDGAHVIGNTDIAVHAGVGTFAADTIVFGNHAQEYQISASTINDPETQITVNPPLVSNVPDGTSITQIPTHQVTPALGSVAPVRGGLITDRKIVAGSDAGDGQGKVQYVGDEAQPDGFTYAMFLWACHGCYSPSTQPIQQLYFWNNAMEGSASGVLFDQGFQPILTAIGTLATEAGTGGRVLLPGYANWTDNLYAGSYDDRNGRRWVWIGLRGILRDWALGIRPAPMNLGGVPFCVNGYGMDSTLDGTGTEVRDLHDQLVLAFNNFAWGDYQSGAPLADPVFPDNASLTLLDLVAIARAKTHGATLVTGGFRGDWSLGVDNEQITMQEFLKRFVLSLGVEQSWNRRTQWTIDRQIFDETAAMTNAPTLTDERDIKKLSFEIDERPSEQFTALRFLHTRDELRRDPSGWRSSSADTNVADAVDEYADDAGTITKYSPSGTKLYSQPLNFYLLRGKNRADDATEYQQGSDTINAVLLYKLAMAKVRVFALTTWGKGYTIEIFDRLWIQHLANVGGRTARPTRVVEHLAHPDRWRCTLKCFDLAGLPGF